MFLQFDNKGLNQVRYTGCNFSGNFLNSGNFIKFKFSISGNSSLFKLRLKLEFQEIQEDPIYIPVDMYTFRLYTNLHCLNICIKYAN